MVRQIRAFLGWLWELLPCKRIFLGPIRALGILPESVFRHLHFRGVFTFHVAGKPIRFRSYGNIIENSVYWSGPFGVWEGESLRLWASLAARSEVILDVGANSGLFALVAQAVNPSAYVAAFEPVPRVFDRLVENAGLNGNRVHCVRVAVSDRTGSVRMYDPGGEHPLSASLDPTAFGKGVGENWREVVVESLRLDDFLADAGLVPSLLKVDAEGHELGVLRGLGEMLGRHRPTILVEALTEGHVRDLLALVRDWEYAQFQVDEGRGALPPQRQECRGAACNLLLLRPGLAQELGLPISTP